MEEYTALRDYFKTLATQHLSILHGANGGDKKFLEFSNEELMIGSANQIPDMDFGQFMIFSPFMDRLKAPAYTTRERQLLVYIQQGCSLKDYEAMSLARDNTYKTVIQILARMQQDSQDGNEVLAHCFDQINNVTIIPNEIKQGTTVYIGWQIGFTFYLPFAFCHEPENWQE